MYLRCAQLGARSKGCVQVRGCLRVNQIYTSNNSKPRSQQTRTRIPGNENEDSNKPNSGLQNIQASKPKPAFGQTQTRTPVDENRDSRTPSPGLQRTKPRTPANQAQDSSKQEHVLATQARHSRKRKPGFQQTKPRTPANFHGTPTI